MVQTVWKGICQYLSYTCTYALIQNSTSIVTCNIQYAKKKKITALFTIIDIKNTQNAQPWEIIE